MLPGGHVGRLPQATARHDTPPIEAGEPLRACRQSRMDALILVGADVVGRAPGPGTASQVERGHTEGHAGGAGGGAGIDRHGAAPEVVISRDVPGVVHEQGTELGAGERNVTDLHVAPDIPIGGVIEDVVVVNIMASEGGSLVNPVLATIHNDVVVHGRVIVDHDGGIGGELNAVPPPVCDPVVGDDQVRGAVVGLNARGRCPSHDVVLHQAIRTGDV